MELLTGLETEIKQAIARLKEELVSFGGGRATPKLVEDISVNYLGGVLTVKQLGSISVNPPREIVVSVWDKNSVAAVAKAIEDSSLRGTAAVSGNSVRVVLPELTGERKAELIKLAKAEVEETRIKIRRLRDEANEKTLADFKAKKIGEDEKFKLKKEIQQIVDKYNEEADNILKSKIGEISE